MEFATGEHEALRYGESKIDNRHNREVVPQFLSVAQGSSRDHEKKKRNVVVAEEKNAQMNAQVFNL